METTVFIATNDLAGYVGRLLLSKDPFSDIGFKLNVVLLTIAPAFISAGIYITLKHAVIIFGRHLSHLPPNVLHQLRRLLLKILVAPVFG